MCGKKLRNTLMVGLSVVVAVLMGIVPLKTAVADGPGPTPVPASFSRQDDQGIAKPEMGVTSRGETYSSIAVLFTQNWWNWKYSYHSTSSSQGTNSLQIWCDAKAHGRYGGSWYWVDSLWKSTWGTYLSVGGSKDKSGEFSVWTHGTHLFDYGPGNWVWRYSDSYDATWWP
jgi:hypothetical protein